MRGFIPQDKNAEGPSKHLAQAVLASRVLRSPPDPEKSQPTTTLQPPPLLKAVPAVGALPTAAADAVTRRTAVQLLHSRSHLVLRRAPDEQVRVEVEPVGARRALPADMGLPVDRQEAAAAVAVHHQLVPLARLDTDLAGDGDGARASVKPAEEGEACVRATLLKGDICAMAQELLHPREKPGALRSPPSLPIAGAGCQLKHTAIPLRRASGLSA